MDGKMLAGAIVENVELLAWSMHHDTPLWLKFTAQGVMAGLHRPKEVLRRHSAHNVFNWIEGRPRLHILRL